MPHHFVDLAGTVRYLRPRGGYRLALEIVGIAAGFYGTRGRGLQLRLTDAGGISAESKMMQVFLKQLENQPPASTKFFEKHHNTAPKTFPRCAASTEPTSLHS